MKRNVTFLLAVLTLAAFLIAPLGMSGQVVSGTTYNTEKTSSLPTGWSCNATNAGGSSSGYYLLLGTSTNYIQTSEFTQNGFTKIVVKARKYGGPTTAQAKISVSWYDKSTSAETVLGTIDPTSTTLSNYTISSPTNPTGNTSGYIKLQCKGASNNVGSGICQVTITYTAGTIPTTPYTVTLGDTGTTLTETAAGAGVTLPTRSDVSPYTFAGWSTTNNQTETTTAPTIISAGTYHPTADITLYPVYTRSESEEVTQWQKVSFPSSGSSLSGTYALLTPDGHAFNGTFSSGHGQVTSTAFAFNSSNVATSVPSDVCELTFESVSGGFKIKNANSSSTQYFYASAASSGKLAWHSSESSYWRSTGSNLLYNSNSAYLRAYNNSSIRSYSSTSGSAISFAKKVQASVSVNYYISVVTLPLEITISGNDITIDADDDDVHTVAVSYENLNTGNLNVTEYLFVECYTDASCTTSVPSNHWFTANFEVAGSSTDYESIEYMAEVNTVAESRTVYMRVEHYSQTTDSWIYSNVIAVTQEAATNPTCTISPEYYDFGNVAINSTQSYTFYVSFANLTSALAVSIDNTANGFSVSPATIAANATSPAEVTVTFAPAAATSALTATLTVSGGGLEDDVEVLVGGRAVPSYTVTYSCNGGKAQAPAGATVLDGGRYQLADGANLNSDFTFVGWTIDPEVVDDEDIFAAGEWINVSSDETYYAVYSRTEFFPTDAAYVKVTQAPSNNDWSGEYLIVYESDIDSQIEDLRHLYVLDSPNGNLDENTYAKYGDIISYYDDGKVEYNETTAAYKVTVAATTNGYSIYDDGNEAYLGLSYTGSNNGTYLRWDQNYTVRQNEWTLGVGSVVSVNNSAKAIRWNNNSGSYRFAIYATTGQQAIQLYKYTVNGTSTTSRYTRVFLNETATDDIEINGKSVIPTGYYLNMGTGNDLYSSIAENLVIEEGAQLFHTTDGALATVKKHFNGYGATYDAETNSNSGYYLFATPVSIDADDVVGLLTDDDAEGSTFDLFSFAANQPQEEWQNFWNWSSEELEGFTGYLYANKNATDVTFSGEMWTMPEQGETMYPTYYSDGNYVLNGWNLYGNSYVCNIYLTAGNGSDVAFYKMNAAGNGFEAYTSGTAIKPTEGFFVHATAASQEFNVSTLVPQAKGKLQLRLNSIAHRGGKTIDNAIIRFGEGNLLPKLQFDENGSKIYFTQNGTDYAVVNTQCEGEIPVSFKAEKSGTYNLSVESENVDVYYLHLIDNRNGADIDLLQTPSYSFDAKPSDYASRFKLVFKANTGIEENASTSSETFAYFNGNAWVINNAGNATLQVIDMMGRVLSSETINGNTAVNINEAAGIYMLRLVNGENVMVQKVVVR